MDWQEGKHFLGHCAVEGDLIVRKRDAAAYKTRGTRRGRRIEDLAKKNGSVVARIRSSGGCAQEGGKVAGALCIRGQSRDTAVAFVVPILLPREKEKAFVVAVVQLRNPYRAAQASTKIVLMVSRLWRSVQIVEPRICVQLIVTQNVERRAVERVRS